jgi:hypothetical protein
MSYDAVTDDEPCTDCEDTGITTQTERRCACRPARPESMSIVDLIMERMAERIKEPRL